MLGYADYVFTGTFAFEIVLKVTGITGVCFRGLLLCVTHGQDTWCAFGYFQFLSSVINLHFFFFKTKGFFSYNHSTFCCYFFKKTLECMWELFWLPNSDWELYFASFFLISSEICQLTTDPMLCVNFLPPFLSSKSEEKPSSEGGNVSLVSLIALCFWCPEIVTHYFLATRFAR